MRAESLVRLQPGQDAVESYHDRVRESVLASLGAVELAATHGRLARTLAATGVADPEALTMHFLAAGDETGARGYAETAAVRVEEKLAFARAVELYRIALRLALPADVQRLRARLGDALVHAGHGADAATVYLTALDGAPPALAHDLRRRAAEQFLRSGHIDEGLTTARSVLEAVGVKLPRTPGRALVSLLLHRTRLRLRGLGFRSRRAGDIPPEVLARVDACWSIGTGLTAVDTIRGAELHARHTLLALEAGEPSRIVRALSFEGIGAALEGGASGFRRATQLIAHADELARQTQDPHDLAIASTTAAALAWCQARWHAAVEQCLRALGMFAQVSKGVAWEVGSIQAWWLLPAYYQLGELGALLDRVPSCLKEAEALGDLYTSTSLRTNILPVAFIAQDRADEALRVSVDAIARWTRGVTVQHWSAQFTQGSALLYQHEAARVLDELRANWPGLARSLIFRLPRSRMQLLQLRARAGLMLAEDAHDRAPLLRQVEADLAGVARTGGAWAENLALMLSAGLARLRGDQARALLLVERAEAGFTALDMALFARAAQRRRGQLCGGEAGRALVEAADGWMRAQRIVRPDRLVAAMAPGF